MEMSYTRTFQIDTLHVDCFGRVKPSKLLYFAQEAAGDHCRLLEADWDTLQEKHLFWALIRTTVEITRLPVVGETLEVETWPMPTTRTAYPRCTVATDGEGREVFRSVSLWVLMDTRTRAMVLPGKSGVEIMGMLRGDELDAPRSLPPVISAKLQERTVRFCDLDRNGHMNNTFYPDWIMDLLDGDFHRDHPLRRMTLCYLSEAREGDELQLYHEVDGEGILTVDAHRRRTDDPRKTERVFAARLQF